MSKTNPIDQWETPPEQFQAVGFERVNPERNEQRYYYIAWQPTLIDAGRWYASMAGKVADSKYRRRLRLIHLQKPGQRSKNIFAPGCGMGIE